MNENKNDGGSAYPGKRLVQRYRSGNTPAFDEVNDSGMTLRDYFAGQALIGYMSSKTYRIFDLEQDPEILFKIADAILKEREK